MSSRCSMVNGEADSVSAATGPTTAAFERLEQNRQITDGEWIGCVDDGEDNGLAILRWPEVDGSARLWGRVVGRIGDEIGGDEAQLGAATVHNEFGVVAWSAGLVVTWDLQLAERVLQRGRDR